MGSEDMGKVIVVGGGASGFFAAIVAAELIPGSEVILLEAGAEPLAKVRISGGGRCNVTHACFEPAALVQAYPRGQKALRGAFSRFQPKDTLAWFTARGVALKTEADGRIFPVSDDSGTIVECLKRSATEAGVTLRVRCPVTTLAILPREESKHPQFQVGTRDGTIFQGDRVLLATGSSPVGYRLAAGLGHRILAPVPSLFSFNIPPETGIRDLAGVSVAGVQATLQVGTERFSQSGDLLITHWGMSGPVILKLSAWGARALHDRHYEGELWVNWCHPQTAAEVKTGLGEIKIQEARKQVINYRPFNLPQRLWHFLLETQQIPLEKRWADLSKSELQRMVQALTQNPYPVRGKGAFKDEFVTCGGVDLKSVDFKTMASRCCPGLYFAGEILDIDGITGGFNFQSAWTTGWLAAQGIGASFHQS